jgi:MFS family permease
MITLSDQASVPARGLTSDFWKFWTGQVVSQLGSSFTIVALPLLIYKITASPLFLSLSLVTTTLPYLLFGLVLGAWADRADRKRLMIGVDIARAAVMASIPALAAVGHLTIWWIYGAGFLISTLSIAFNAAQFAALPLLVNQDDLVTANGRIQASFAAATVAGPLLAGLLLVVLPLTDVLLVDSITFLVSAATLAAILRSFNGPRSGAGRASSLRADIVAGLRFVLGHPVLRPISLMMALVNFVSSTILAQTVFFAKHQLAASNAQVSLLYAADAVGALALSLAAGWASKRWTLSQVMLGTLALEGLLTVLLAAIPVYWIAVPLWALISGLGVLFNINTSSFRQAVVPNEMLGRVMTIAQVLAWSVIPLGALIGGVIIAWTGNVALVFAASGALLVLIAIGFSVTPLGHAERYLA